MIARILNPFRKPAPAPRPFTDAELAAALNLRRVVLVRPHVRAKPVNEKREALHARLRAEVEGRA